MRLGGKHSELASFLKEIPRTSRQYAKMPPGCDKRLRLPALRVAEDSPIADRCSSR
jgi:hypothetical protein